MVKNIQDLDEPNRKLNILLWHGYMLSDTGSNIYVQNLSRQLCLLGHDVYLFSQDTDPLRFDFVSDAWIFNGKNDDILPAGSKECPAYPGRCRAYKPHIGDILPVYVLDHYDGFTAKKFLDLSDDELSGYVETNSKALEWLVDRVNIDMIEAGHAVMAPFIVKDTAVAGSIPYFVIIHGSDIEFTIRPSERYRKYAAAGFEGASAIITITAHVVDTVNQIFGTAFNNKLRLIPPGVDVDIFRPIDDRLRAFDSFMKSCDRLLKEKPGGFSGERQGRMIAAACLDNISADSLVKIHATYNDRNPDSDLLEKLAPLSTNDRFIVFVGKLMTTKGIHLALAAMPLILIQVPAAKLIVVGFGDLREYLELLIDAMAGGDKDLVLAVADIIDAAVEGPPFLGNFYRSLAGSGEIDDYMEKAKGLRDAVIITGILYHEQLRFLLPLADVQLILSIFPEAFGLVALEGVSCGTLPVITDHSGLRDVADILAKESGIDMAGLRLRLDADKVVVDLASKVIAILEMHPAKRAAITKELSDVPRRLFSWKTMAEEHLKLLQV